MLEEYVPLLIAHITLAFLSPVLFSVRAWRSIQGVDPARGWLRVVPHVVDTLLLLSGIGLAVAIRQYPFVNGWLTAKVLALIAYIGVGRAAARQARSRNVKVFAWLGGIAIVLYIYGVAVTKDPALGVRGSGAQDVQTRIDSLFHSYQGAVPGASVLVVRDGQAVFRHAYGLAELENPVEATPATNYRLASMTKQFTAAAILLLAEDGRLSLEDPIRKWLPTLPDATTSITIRQLLTHTSGLIDYEDVIPSGTTQQLHDADVLHLLEKQNRTYFEPGTQYRYSDSGYSLLALIVGKASGQDFASFLRERIFLPLGMRNTVAFEEGISTVANRAFGYTAAAGAWTRTDQSLTSAVLGDGGIYSSIDDLAKWDAALYDTRLLHAESLRLAFTPAIRASQVVVGPDSGARPLPGVDRQP